MNIIYNNELGELITAQQVVNLADYQKVYMADSSQLIKKTEHYQDNVLNKIDYYLDANESEDEAISQLLPFNCAFTIIERETYNNYTIEHGSHSYNGSLVSKTNVLLNANNLQICYEELDLSTQLPKYKYTEKNLGEYVDETSTNYCWLHYNADGSLDYCDYNYLSDQDGDRFDISILPRVKDMFQLSDAMYNYYLTADFTPPSV